MKSSTETACDLAVSTASLTTCCQGDLTGNESRSAVKADFTAIGFTHGLPVTGSDSEAR
ncbi:hypothetical protein ACFQ5M_13590 [Agrilactobacillus yilanensis]|uniref:Uncharacterized protein n=1 Tax=Agrilactobacillus yilanensis TaxID=2485997 RepID=A0ABW4JBL1_9LACO|nr:hypothetical protein [Agrilactobacillus yilanensis]